MEELKRELEQIEKRKAEIEYQLYIMEKYELE
jgi:hypothetical protein